MEYNDLFHVHTFRCKHSENVSDETYIQEAINLNANSITFTDHSPFPGDPFSNRMSFLELENYINSVNQLKNKYANCIDVKLGLEIEYLPRFTDYYLFLQEKNIDLYLGQHICEYNNQYNFSYSDKSEEYLWFTESILQAIDTKFFKGIMHPDRIFKNTSPKVPLENIQYAASLIWGASKNNNIPIEDNYASELSNKHFKDVFFSCKTHNSIIYGLDAHSPLELVNGTAFFRNH